MLTIKRIEITDVLGTHHTVFEPGTLTVITGANGEGKSSILEAVKKCFSGGHDSGMLRRGAKFGEIELTLSNNAVIKVRITPKNTTYTVNGPDGLSISAPSAYIEQLGEALAVDPSKVLTAKPKELAEELLKIMPVQFSTDELQAAAGEETWSIPSRSLSLEEFDSLFKQVYDTRTQVNRTLRDKEGTLKSLRSSLPEHDGEQNWAEVATGYRATLQETKQARESEIAVINRVEREAIEEIKARAQREIDEVKGQANTARSEKDAEYQPVLLKITAAIAEAEERQRTYDRAAGIRSSIEQIEREYERDTKMSERFSKALERLAELKQEKLAATPIPGLVVRDGQVFLDDVPFEHVNLAERIRIALKISSLRSGELPFLILDNSEAMDPETWQAFCEGVQRKGFQVIAARVSEGPLKIETAEQEALV